MEHFLDQYGLLALALLAVVESDGALVLGGVIAHLGHFDLVSAIAAGTLGSFAADCAWFQVGRLRAPTAAAPPPAAVSWIDRLAARLGLWELALARVVYGTRIASMLWWGRRRTPFARFAAVDLATCVVWASLLATLGYSSSTAAAALLGRVRAVEEWIAVAFVAALAFTIALRRFAAWRQHPK